MNKNITVFFTNGSREFNGVGSINYDAQLNTWVLNSSDNNVNVLIQRENVTHIIVTEGQKIDDGNGEMGDGGGEEL